MPSPIPSSTFRQLLFSRNARRVWAVAALASAIAVATLAWTPGTVELPSFGWDKGDHVAAFAVMALCGLFGWRGRPRVTLTLTLALTALGIAIEIGQHFVPGRTADWRDVVADVVGVGLGLALAHGVAHRFDRRARPRASDWR